MRYVSSEIELQPTAWRRAADLVPRLEGESDFFTAASFPPDRDYDRVITITRSGTTTEAIDALGRVAAVGPRSPRTQARRSSRSATT